MTGTGYTAGGATLASKTITYTAGTNTQSLDAADVTMGQLHDHRPLRRHLQVDGHREHVAADRLRRLRPGRRELGRQLHDHVGRRRHPHPDHGLTDGVTITVRCQVTPAGTVVASVVAAGVACAVLPPLAYSGGGFGDSFGSTFGGLKTLADVGIRAPPSRPRTRAGSPGKLDRRHRASSRRGGFHGRVRRRYRRREADLGHRGAAGRDRRNMPAIVLPSRPMNFTTPRTIYRG